MVAVLNLRAAQGQQQQPNNNRQQQAQQDPNAPKGAIAGHVIEQGRGIPVKKAQVQLERVNNPQTQQAAQPTAAPAGAVGTTANQGSTLGSTVGTTAAAAGQQTGRPNNNNPQQGGNNNFQQGNNNFQGNQGGGRNQTQTGNDGSFVFNDVPAGEYIVRVQLDQYLTQEYGQRTLSGKGTPISLQPGERLDSIDFQMIKAGVISGTVLDEDGQPMANVQIQALSYDYTNGKRTLRSIGTARTTNDLGEYRLYYLAPGDYYVTARPANNQGNRGFDAIRGIIDSLPRDQRDQVFQQIQNQRGNNNNDQGGRDSKPGLG
jgi:5-hydroxyisourate hydrolase-like protein (transthyretin family)